ncbi:thioredoxin-dependent thiol peroxidase [Candidatus Nitrospira salsa]
MKNTTTASRNKAAKRTTTANSQAIKKMTKPTKAINAKAASTSATTLKVGQKAPAFTLLNDKGETVKLSELKGKTVVLFFYPKDDTPGCTKEACSFRDGLRDIQKRGAIVVGVSPDSVESHKKFSKKFDLNFPLLSDVEKTMLQAYGVWKEKSMYGRTYMGIERTTFIIDEKGKIAAVFPKVKVDQHYDQVLQALQEKS